MYSADSPDIEKLSEKLPDPSGYKILLAVAKMEEKKGSLLLPEQYRNLEDTASIIGMVLKIGADCYKDDKKFPTGPWAKVGDWVVFRSYTGTRFRVGDQEFRFINDDAIDGVVADPRSIERV